MDVDVTAGGALFSLLFVLVVFWIAKKNDFFKLPPPSSSVPVTLIQTLGAFLTYLLFAFIVLPLTLLLIVFLRTGEVAAIKHLSAVWMGWIQVVALWTLFFLLGLYCFLIAPQTRHFIFWGEKERSFARFCKGIGMGVVACAVSYPFVLLTGLIAKFISLKVWGEVEVEQVAVKQLKMAIGNSFLLPFILIAIIFLVPFVEELLFRGFFQNLLKRHLGRKWAIAISSTVFALAHFSMSQGVGNFQIIITLATLAFFLGFIYERERTLWASFGLHMTFNAFNVLMIVFTK